LQQVDGPALKMLRRRTAPVGRFFGYGIDEPVPVAPLLEAGGLLMTGLQAAERLEQFRAKDGQFAKRPDPRLADRALNPKVMGPSTAKSRKRKQQKRERATRRSAPVSKAPLAPARSVATRLRRALRELGSSS